MVTKAVQQAYEPYGAQCKPVSVLFLDMPDMEFDVNVHTAKREVRFANQNLVFLVVTHAIRDTFTKDMEANSPLIDLSDEIAGARGTIARTRDASISPNPFADDVHEPKVPYGFSEPIRTPSISTSPAPGFATKESSGDIPEMSNRPSNFSFEKPRKANAFEDLAQDMFSTPEAGKVISLERNEALKHTAPEPAWNPPTFFQIANTYIAGEDSNGLLVIDQHAAHSRVLYEQALDILKNGAALDSQELLFPELLELSKIEVEALKSVEDQFKHLGFYIEHFGGETYQIRAIPSALPLSRAIKAVKDFLDSIGDEGKGEGDMVKVQDTIAKAWANTNAYQAGDKLKSEEMAALVSQLMLTEEPLKSPYGHPTLLRFTLDELAKKFRR
jgi:DNA mismatch repair protein MutL